jgi:hypothetical protein
MVSGVKWRAEAAAFSIHPDRYFFRVNERESKVNNFWNLIPGIKKVGFRE